MVKSSSFEKIRILGTKISDEMGRSHRDETLARWMAFRIAELIEAIENAAQPQVAEQLKTECADLICRLWSQRETWPYGSPLSNLRQLIEALQQKENYAKQKEDPAGNYLRLRNTLSKISEAEADLCLDAEIAGMDLEVEQSYLDHHRESLSEDEIALLEWVVARRKRLEKPIRFSTEDSPDLVHLTPKKRITAVSDRLHKLLKQRLEAIDSLKMRRKRKAD